MFLSTSLFKNSLKIYAVVNFIEMVIAVLLLFFLRSKIMLLKTS